MPTIYDVLRVLARHGWRQKARIGLLRILEHPRGPRVYLYGRGKLSLPLSRIDIKEILARAGIEENGP